MIKSLMLSTALAALLSPLLTELEEVDLDSIQEWGNKGLTKDSAIPIKGVFLFRGLVPPLLMVVGPGELKPRGLRLES